ncbi:uncharacterized protein LOC115623954 [Scaptodrosophila lebanonensis]|uniref:Uncharacterized protein LOC115623813 n=1 Tax=Drosophila lebanonensis TaxID=7225 RepID=A0A6J2TH08_DROLE|nr:uncharacterized protein LOC115623813 [Scaptodrosophila lebanonensis]XP_030374378.1 uncharacterized protein LOC115623954 [Scaptodrosophila lebanonensis]
MAPSSTESQSSPNAGLLIPKWINEDYFRHIVEEEYPDLVGIKRFTPIAATAPGENYTSVMVRVNVDVELKDGSTQQASYILKTMLESAASAQFVKAMGLFPKEKQMYEVLIPAFEKFYRAAGEELKLAPNCLHVDESPERITLIMEDLRRKNFSNVDRLKGFDLPHMRAVLRKLAELHAASVVYYELNGPYDPHFNLGMINETNRKMFEAIANARQSLYLQAIHQWGLDDPEYFIGKIIKPTDASDEAIRLSQVDPNEFNVLNHGDCWSNNIMFRHKENGDIDQTLFVDLQISKWGSPAQDLWYLITTSAALDIKVKEFDHFIKIYHERLVECLKLLQYSKKLPALKEIHSLMIKYSYWGPFTANGVMVFTLLPTDKDANIESAMQLGPEGDALRLKSLLNPYYSKAMAILLPFFDNKGALDIDKKP